MKTQLLEKGLADAVFEPGDGREIQGEEMDALCHTLASMEEALIALERRGINLRAHAERADLETGKLPVIHVFLGRQEYWFRGRVTLDEFLKEQESTARAASCRSTMPTEQRRSREDDGEDERAADAAATAHHRTARSAHDQLRPEGAGRSWASTSNRLIPQERTGVEEPRYVLRRGDSTTPLEDLRGLPPAIRAAGEKGLQVTRFKGLGEMNAEELRETTLDPANRTLVQGQHAGCRRRRRDVPRPDGRQGRTAPRVHREARPRRPQSGRVKPLLGVGH